MKVIFKKKHLSIFLATLLELCLEIWQFKKIKIKTAPILTTENLQKHLIFAAVNFTDLAK